MISSSHGFFDDRCQSRLIVTKCSGPGRTPALSPPAGLLALDFFLESIFIDQAARNGTRPNSPSGVKPARPLVGLVGRYFMVQFPAGMGPTPEDLFVTGLGRWSSVPSVKEIVG